MTEWQKGFMWGLGSEAVALFVGLLVIRYRQWKDWHS